ncbi:pentatricopeptide repeat-containing protein At3g09650, chloroplastic [Sorghum bicolor]|uniref:pentatricopeptide repeat-containing protein At3g09650, chloroplastic n=1 Tax=Sorghum bicolor TaxID=4558 RepID=UPI0001A846E2|nr:pentatricopeptide repeat-containing protein At3g09650, chloroplastic [Sorghum bicolor]|eukprot:XP_002456190.1 pentatricopeptide repeat-containing protein At3g09650, chloroplastic [Sorghum bicolor]
MLCRTRYSLQRLQPHPAFPGGATCSCSCSCSPPSSSSGNQHQRLHPAAALSPATSRSTAPLTHAPDHDDDGASDDALLALLRAHDTDAAYSLFSSMPSALPSSPTTASRLLAQLSFNSNGPDAFSRAARLLQSLRARGALDLLDANSLSLAAAAAARSRDSRLAHSLLLYMLRQGLLPDRRAYTAAVARLTPPTKALRLFDAVLRHLRRSPPELVSPSCLPDAAAFNSALSACADAGDCRRFRQLFDAMSEWSAAADALTYNVVIKMCARAGRKDLVARVLERMLSSGLAPCATTFHSLVAAFVGFGDIATAERIVQAMREERKDICLLLRAVAMDCDGATDVVEEGAALLDDIVAGSEQELGADEVPLLPKAYPPNARVYTTLMKGYMNAGRVDDVVAVLRAMRQEARTAPASRPDHVTYTTVMSALVGAGDVARAHAVLDEMAADGVPANRVTYNVLLKGYCQQLQIGKARELFEEMVTDAGIQPGVVTYNTLMDGCVLSDDSAGALAFFNEMRSRGIAPSTVSYTTLMKAFAVSGQPKVAHKVFEEMERDPRVTVDRAAWNMLVEGYCRLGQVETAKQVVERMKERGVQPDVATYGSLAKGVAMARKPGEALVLWNEVKERCLEEADEELLGALADVCVRAAFFKKALEIVACMEEKGIAPNKTKYKKMYIEMHSRMFTSKHASQARQDRRRERKRAAEAFKFWLGLPNSYYGSEWRIEPVLDGDDPI